MDEEIGSVVEVDGCRLIVGPYVEAAPDHHMPRWLEIELSGFGEPTVQGRIELRDNIPRIVEISFHADQDSREVMPKDLREVDLYSVIDVLYNGLVIRVDHADRKVRYSTDPDSFYSRQVRDFLQQRRSGKRRITGAFLQQVADVYRTNIDYAPTDAVAKTFGVKHRQATDYVKQARDRGLLPPTQQGKAKA